MAVTTEQKVGIFFLVALVTLGFMIELVEDWKPFEDQIPYQTYFTSAVGIKVGDPVRIAGVEVGKVEAITIEDSQVRIDFFVVNGTQVRQDSVASIRQTNLLGGQFLGLTFGSPDSPPLEAGGTLLARESTNIDQLITNFDRNQERVLGNLSDLIEESRDPLKKSVERIENIIRKIDEGQGTLGRIVNDPKLYDEVQKSVAHLGAVLERLESGEGTLGRLLTDPALYDDASATLANIKEISGDLREGKGTLGRLLHDESLFDNASDALANIRDITDKANRGEGTLGKLVTDDALYEEFYGSMSRINSIAAKIDDGQGTVGRLINEDDLYREAKTTLHKVEKTVDGVSDSGPLSALGVVLGTLF